jgi:hypothetical protein
MRRRRCAKMSHNYFCVFQNGYVIFGIGNTEEEAMNDAKKWLGHEDQDLVWDCLVPYPQAVDGELTILPCTEELFGFIQDGGDPGEFHVIRDDNNNLVVDHDPTRGCGGRSCDECEIGGCDHGREVQ